MKEIQYGRQSFSPETEGKQKISLLPTVCMFIVFMCFSGSASAGIGAVHRDVPSVIDTNARYLFYLHGQAIERGGRHAQSYDYQGIIRALADRGFIVIGEERGPIDNRPYAKKVSGQVEKLLAAGVPAMNITVAGHSKGGMITLIVMTMLDNPDIAYANFAGCGLEGGSRSGGIGRFAAEEASKARGRLLSAYERGDAISGSCKAVMEKMSGAFARERVLDFGGGHELFYKPDKAWIDILQAWAERREQ